MSIQPLPDDVIAHIKSSTTITTLNGVVCGLIKNSLDAGATKVIVSVDYVRGVCSVEDNGLGIPPAEFYPTGGLGKLHSTSRYPVRGDVHGKYGAFLASLASLSLLSITSHHHKFHSHNSIRIHNSNVLARHTPSPTDQKLLSFPHGTRATVRDLFGSMPVRVKQRAIDVERGLHSKHWELLKRDIVALMLAWNGPISVSAQEPPNRWAFSLQCGEIHRDGKGENFNLTARVSKILHQAHFSDEHNLETWVPLRASAGRLSAVGAVSLRPVATKRIQFISLGIRPVPNEQGSNVLYEEINRTFSNSSYGMEEPKRDSELDEDNGANGGRYKSDGFTDQELKGRKGADRWPMFYINIQTGRNTDYTVSHEMDELLDERQGDLAAVVDVLQAVIYEFLKKYHFRPKRIKDARESKFNRDSLPNSPQRTQSSKYQPKSTEATVYRKECLVGDLVTTKLGIRNDGCSRLRPESPFDSFPGIKSGLPQPLVCGKNDNKKPADDKIQTSSHSVAQASDFNSADLVSHSPLFSPGGSLLRAPFSGLNLTVKSTDRDCQPMETGSNSLSGGISWTNPSTKEVLIVDPITGFAKRPQTDEERKTQNTTYPKRLRVHAKPTLKGDRSIWLEDLLSSWENPIFKTTQPPIPSAFQEESTLRRPMQSHGCSTWLRGFSEAGPSIQGRVSKGALIDAEIIAQVDRKFIFAKVPANPYIYGPTMPCSAMPILIIVDQHAADERCRVESLMRSYFEQSVPGISTACTELLRRPLTFDISTNDATRFEAMAAHFAHWGIRYKVMSISQDGNARHKQISVTELPPSIAERCRLEPRLLIDFLRKEAWAMDENGRRNAQTQSLKLEDGEVTPPQWITLFHGCPEGILDMINSRACRSSIMFNDPLSREECTDLLKRLADCAFPFQCAHGRPSMVPLVHIGDDMACTTNERKSDDSFMKAFKSWSADGRKTSDER